MIDSKSQNVREALLGLKISKTYEENWKSLNTLEIPALKEILEYLREKEKSDIPISDDRCHSDIHLLKEGLIWETLETCQRLLPYGCGTCKLETKNTANNIRCRCCNIKACSLCYMTDGFSPLKFICTMCDTLLNPIVNIPMGMLNSRFKKKLKSNTGNSSSQPSQSKDDELDDDLSQVPGYRCGQGDRVQSPSQSQGPSQSQEPPLSQGQKTSQDPQDFLDELRKSQQTGNPSNKENLGGNDDGFSLSKKEQKKKRQKEKMEEKKKQKESDEVKSNTVCRYFLKGTCKFGFMGKSPKDDISQCPYKHPKPCSKYLNNGTMEGGCQKGDQCSLLHLKLCPESLATRSCSTMTKGSRCTRGYHLRNTGLPPPALVPPGPASHPLINSGGGGGTGGATAGCGGVSLSDKETLSSFLGEIVRSEVNKLKGELRTELRSDLQSLTQTPMVSQPVQVFPQPSPKVNQRQLNAILAILYQE